MAFIDEVIAPFIVSGAPTKQNEFAFGQILSAPVYYPHQLLEIWRPKNFDQRLHTASDFNIKTGVQDAFKKPLPYSFPGLRVNEEFIAIKSKIRPVVLIQPPDAALAQVGKVSMGINLERHLCVVAPAFGLENEEGYSRVSEDFLVRVRKLEYPQFLFLAKSGPLTKDSLVRLDELQSVAIRHLQPTGFAFSKEALSLFRSQVSLFTGGSDGSEFATYRELLAE
jgi:hypothetical protein